MGKFLFLFLVFAIVVVSVWVGAGQLSDGIASGAASWAARDVAVAQIESGTKIRLRELDMTENAMNRGMDSLLVVVVILLVMLGGIAALYVASKSDGRTPEEREYERFVEQALRAESRYHRENEGGGW